jgi:peptide/nickel transport system substrate-binding protein
MAGDHDSQHGGVTRRAFLERAGVAGLGIAGLGVLAACGGSDSAPAGSSTGAIEASRGGKLTVATVFATPQDLDPHAIANGADGEFRQFNIYSQLAGFDPKGQLEMRLAESIEPSNATGDEWVIKLRDGVTFHDGSALTPDDVIYSLQRVMTKKLALEGYVDLQMVDPSGFKKLDSTSFSMRLRYPYAELPAQLAQRTLSIVKDGQSSFTVATTNGTGPFELTSFKPLDSIGLARYPNYWEPGLPYVDEATIVNIADATARLNALRAGEVDAIDQVDASQLPVLQKEDGVEIGISDSDGWTGISMNTTKPPFDDVQVRQAMRLLADRQQLIDQAQAGYGLVANDLFSRFDPLYNESLDQREHDPEQAKSLLTAAGQGDTTFMLNSADAGPAMLSSALVYAEQCKQAGVAVEVKRSEANTYWDSIYGNVGFQQTWYAHRPFIPQYFQALAPDGVYNATETAWGDDESQRLFAEGVRTLDDAKRAEIMGEVQRILWDTGGYLIWGFWALFDAHRSKVAGFEKNVNRPLNNRTLSSVSIVSG